MKTSWVVVLAAAVACLAEQGLVETPALGRFEVLREGHEVAQVAKAQVETTGVYVGMAFVCDERPGAGVRVEVFFGPFAEDGRPVQLAVRTRGGAVERFGGVVRGGLAAGFHSPVVSGWEDVRRFAETALSSESLVSNGFRSFWNNHGRSDNRRLLDWISDCQRKWAAEEEGGG